jgi:hypothetical protein
MSLTSLLTDLSKNIQKVESNDYEKLGVIRYSHYTDFFADKELE